MTQEETSMEKGIKEARKLLEQRKFGEAFERLSAMYNVAAEEEIFCLMQEVFYAPNEDMLKEAYHRNVNTIKNYPYKYGWEEISYSDLPVYFFPVDENTYAFYDKEEEMFLEPEKAKSERETAYFFETLDKPVFAEHETNLFNLEFLRDNVRRSEDFGEDNHIYLFYDSVEELIPLLFISDMEELLKEEKFVFLIGEKQRGRYPIDFKKEFGADYKKTEKPLGIHELKRICFWYKHAHSGTIFSLGVLDANPYVQAESWCDFHSRSLVDGVYNMYHSQKFRDKIGNPDASYTLEEISGMVKNSKLTVEDVEEYLGWLEKKKNPSGKFTMGELFRGYFLFHYEKKQGGIKPRIAPLLVFDPHMWDTRVYNNMVLSFPYRSCLTCMREPIMTFARCYIEGIAGWDEFQTKHLLASDYSQSQFLPPELKSCYYAFRFEDLKLRPKETCRAICRHLNIPFSGEMLKAKAPLTDAYGNTTEGFDKAPLTRDISVVISDFDRVRLMIFYEPILDYYGYPSFDSREYPLPEPLVRELFSYPFRFERFVQPKTTGEKLHAWVQEVLQNAWRCKIDFPRLIPLGEDGDE